jgi:hypothetical protein
MHMNANIITKAKERDNDQSFKNPGKDRQGSF